MTNALVCTAVIGLLIFGLGFWISLRRLRLKTFFAGADGPASFTTKLSRAHGQHRGVRSFLALLFLTVTALGCSLWSETAMIVATISRVVVVIAFLTAGRLDHASRFNWPARSAPISLGSICSSGCSCPDAAFDRPGLQTPRP